MLDLHLGPLTGVLEGWHQDRHEQGDDRDHHQQLDECESPAPALPLCPRHGAYPLRQPPHAGKAAKRCRRQETQIQQNLFYGRADRAAISGWLNPIGYWPLNSRQEPRNAGLDAMLPDFFPEAWRRMAPSPMQKGRPALGRPFAPAFRRVGSSGALQPRHTSGHNAWVL